MTSIAVDVERYRAEGYLTAPAVVGDGLLTELQDEADRLMATCDADPHGYADRIQWEVDYVEPNRRITMDRVIRMIEPVVDLSEVFARLERQPNISDGAAAVLVASGRDDLVVADVAQYRSFPLASPRDPADRYRRL